MRVVLKEKADNQEVLELEVIQVGNDVLARSRGVNLVCFRGDGTIHVWDGAKEFFDFLHFWTVDGQSHHEYFLKTGELRIAK